DYAHYTKFRDKIYSFLDKLIKFAQRESTLEPRFENVIGELVFNVEQGHYALAVYTSTPEISSEYLRIGPKVDELEHVNKFRQKHPNAYIQDNFWVSLKNRNYTLFIELLRDFQARNPIKSLKMVEIGAATNLNYSKLAGQSMGNLAIHVLPYEIRKN
ncbi:MAG: hypothetical protein DRO88_10470, partial [Promethearchaeia archaeon]